LTPRRLAPVVVALLLGLPACGATESASSEKFKGEQRAVAEVVEELADAGGRKDADRICKELFARALREQGDRVAADCVEALRTSLDDADAYDFKVESVTITGNRARARVRSSSPRAGTIDFVREPREWRIAAVDAG